MPLYGALGAVTNGQWAAGGTHAITTAEAGATVPTVTIATGMNSIAVALVQSRSSGNNAELSALDVVTSGGNIVVTNSATTAEFMAAGDVISWIALGNR